MKQIVFNSHRGDAFISRLIRFFSRGEYNHTSILCRDHIYEAHIHTGVRKVPFLEWDNTTVKTVNPFEITPENEQIVYEFLEAQVGKRYDIRGIFAFLFFIARPRKGYWYCSELAKVALCKAIGLKRVNGYYSQLTSPHAFQLELELIKQAMTHCSKMV